jgi:L-ascorbate metabolism protein UlaG (beta-lactamase superfamily)
MEQAMVIRFAAAVLAFALSVPASAQAPSPKPVMREGCPGLVASRHDIIPASFKLAALAPDEVRISYAGHSTFLIESPKSVRIATDYNDYVRLPGVPTIATMNRAHDTHYSEYPNPAIPHVLRGWAAANAPARHDVQVQDVRVRNVPTNIRSWEGGTDRHGNSIFIFEVGSLCIAHLGHLHHLLNQQQLDEMGKIDVLLVPVDGSFTLDLEGMMEVLRAIKAPLMIPMHYFSYYTLQRFLDRATQEKWDVEWAGIPSAVVSRATLPATPKVLVMRGH